MTTLAKINSDFAKDYDTAESVLRDCVINDRQLSFEESQFMQIRLGWDAEQQKRELARVGVVMRRQDVAGTSQDREALVNAVDAAKTDLETKGPELKAQIQELQDELARLEKNHATNARRLSEAKQACEQLTQLVPRHILNKSHSLAKHANETIGREYHELLGQISHIESLTEPGRHADQKAYIDAVRRYGARFIEFDVHRDTNKHIRPEHRGGGWETNYRFHPDWEAHRQSLIDQLPELREQAAELKKQFDAEKMKAEEPLRKYWR